jgi:hypothetical protein
MSPKDQKKMKTQKDQKIEVSEKAVRILRTLKNEEAFYFYETVGKPTGESAKSLSDFLEKVKSVKLESLLFHLQRKDFQNWIKETLGDSTLAGKMEKIAPSSSEGLRTKIRSMVENRIEELRDMPMRLLINEDLVVASSSSTA